MGDHEGLDFINGEVVAMTSLSNMEDIKSPQINWNELKVCRDIGQIITKNLTIEVFILFTHIWPI